MAQTDKYSIRNLKKDFPTDEACLEVIFEGLHSRECSCGGRYKQLNGRPQFQCSKCRFQIAPMSGTLFEKSTTPLTLWFHAIFIFSNAKSGVSAKEIERQLGVTYKTAWRILKLIRESLRQNARKLKGDVEMDEGFFGGHGNGGKYNKNQKQVMKSKTVVIGAIERGGEAKAEVKPDVTATSMGEFMKKNIDPSGTRLFTDKTNRLGRFANEFDRQSVNHSHKEYVRGNVHVNNIESFWSHVKRSIRGTYKSVSKQHFQSYLDAFVFHYNNRHNDKERFASLLGALIG